MSASEEIPFLTVDTGEVYQPIRLTFKIKNLVLLEEQIDDLACIKKINHNTWYWLWCNETAELPFASISNFNQSGAMKIATLLRFGDLLYLNLQSFKRACLAIPFFHNIFNEKSACLLYADFINKVYAYNEQKIEDFSSLFSEQELQTALQQKLHDYQQMQQKCEHASDISQALEIVKSYAALENKKLVSSVERYEFNFKNCTDLSIVFLSFYVFIRSRELAAIKRWFGVTDYSLSNAVDEAMEQIFGDLGIDLID